MEQKNKKKDNQCSDPRGQGSDEVDRAGSYPRALPRKSVKTTYYHESSPGPSGLDRLESPGDDSAYHTFPHHSFASHSYSKSSSMASSDRFPSEDSLRSSSPYGSASKKNHSTLIRIQLGDDKKAHEWYSEFTHHPHQHLNAFDSPLANRSANSSSHFEYDSHIAHMRGKCLMLMVMGS